MTRTRSASTVLLALLVGCTHTMRPAPKPAGVGAASYRVAADTGLAHYPLALGQIATGATPELHAPPAYPAAMLASCPASVELPARVIVRADGQVGEVRIAPAPRQQPFAEAVRTAVQGWRYTPLTFTRWAANADGTSHPVDSETRPFSLDYVFTFRCRHGRTSVSSGAANPPP